MLIPMSAVMLTSCLGVETSCFAINCLAGVYWSATVADGETLPPGEYTVRAVLDDTTTFLIHCEVDNPPSTSRCDGLGTLTGPDAYIAQANLAKQSTGPGEPVAAHGFSLTATKSEPPGVSSEHGGVTGPGRMEVEILHEGEVVFEAGYTLEYTRDERFFGDPECGFCDSEIYVTEDLEIGVSP